MAKPIDPTAPRTASQRQLRVGEELRHIIASIFQADRLHDPALAGKSITVSEVRVGRDLRNASVFVLPLGVDAETDREIFDALKRAAPHITSLVARELRTRRAPRLLFVRDDSYDRADALSALLRRPGVAEDL